jgi:hypothetical protein
MKRSSLTLNEKILMCARQRWLCAVCNDVLHDAEYDHSTPVALGNDAKPDQAICIPCHRLKTIRDVKAIAKAKRLHRTFVLGEKRQKRKMQSRGFDKRWSRRMSGKTVRRIERQQAA